jgi:ribosomal-protein-alanine N-acetyltransferase
MLRPLMPADFESYREVRVRNADWLLQWEPSRISLTADPIHDRSAFIARCSLRDRERQAGTAYGLGLFVDNTFCGEVNLNNVQRGALQTGTVGYWVDQNHAGHGYVAEAVVVLARLAFENLNLHRLEICIIPRNHRSRRVMEKLHIRDEGTALRLLEINGVWEDHIRFAITTEEWGERREQLAREWLNT